MPRGPHTPAISPADWTRSAAKAAGIAVLAAIAACGLWLGLKRVPRETPAGSTPTAAGGRGADTAEPTEPHEAPAGATGAAALAARIDINTATQAELESLPGIGPALAQRIIDDRTRFGAFATSESLTRVKGIGPKTLDRLRPLIRASSVVPSGADETRTRNP